MKKISDGDWRSGKYCRHPEHNPPGMIVLEPGLYEHECPGCKNKQTVIVRDKPIL